MVIEDLSKHVDLIPLLAGWHFRQWRDLTGALTESDYKSLLSKQITAQKLPLTLVAIDHGRLLGSVNIVPCDMDIRSELTLGLPSYTFIRRRGAGASVPHLFARLLLEVGKSDLTTFISILLEHFPLSMNVSGGRGERLSITKIKTGP